MPDPTPVPTAPAAVPTPPAADAQPPAPAPAQPPETQAQTPPAPPPPEDPKATAGRFAALARREARAKAELARLEATKSELAAEREQLAAYQRAKAEAKRVPLAALESLGLTYEELTDAVLAGGRPGAGLQARAASDEVAKLRAELAEKDAKAKADAEAQARAQAEETVAGFRRGIDEFLAARPDEYELTSLWGQQALVFEVVEAAYQSHGRVLTIKEAADLVEADLLAQATRLRGAKKFATIIGSQPQSPAGQQVAGSVQQQQPKSQQQTLTNGLTGTTTAPPSEPTSEEERVQRALAAGARAIAARRKG